MLQLLTNINLSNKVHKVIGKINLKDYIGRIVKNRRGQKD